MFNSALLNDISVICMYNVTNIWLFSVPSSPVLTQRIRIMILNTCFLLLKSKWLTGLHVWLQSPTWWLMGLIYHLLSFLYIRINLLAWVIVMPFVMQDFFFPVLPHFQMSAIFFQWNNPESSMLSDLSQPRTMDSRVPRCTRFSAQSYCCRNNG